MRKAGQARFCPEPVRGDSRRLQHHSLQAACRPVQKAQPQRQGLNGAPRHVQNPSFGEAELPMPKATLSAMTTNNCAGFWSTCQPSCAGSLLSNLTAEPEVFQSAAGREKRCHCRSICVAAHGRAKSRRAFVDQYWQKPLFSGFRFLACVLPAWLQPHTSVALFAQNIPRIPTCQRYA